MIALNPDQVFSFSLDVEARKEEAQQTKFRCRFPTARQLAEIDRLTDEANDKPEAEQKRLLLESAAAASTVLVLPRIACPGSFALDINAGKQDVPLYEVLAVMPEQLAKAQALVEQAEGATPGIALPLVLEAIVILVDEPWDLEHATLGELLEIAGKAIQLSRLAAAKTLEDLSSLDLWEVVVRKIVRLSGLTENDRKKSALRSAAAATRRSALNAPTASA